MKARTLTFIKIGMLLTALAILIGIFSCTDIPQVHHESFIFTPVQDEKEPEVKVLIAQSKSLVISVNGPFKILGENGIDPLYISRESLETTTVRLSEYGIHLDILEEQPLKRIDFVLTRNNAGVSIEGKYYYDTVRFVVHKNKLLAINVLPIEKYLYGVVLGEMGQNMPDEALKAQAIAARNYAVYEYKSNTSKPYHLYRTTVSQMFSSDINSPDNIVNAVDATRGVVMLYENRLFKAYYSSTCGGRTANIQDVWDCFPQVPFSSVQCRYCSGASYFQWESSITKSELRRKLKDKGFRTGVVQSISSSRNNGRIRIVKIKLDEGEIVLTGEKFRQVINYKKKITDPEYLKSTWFAIRDKGNTIFFEGKGFGHGVGMCQIGAKGMAEEGYTFSEILSLYYTGISFIRLY